MSNTRYISPFFQFSKTKSPIITFLSSHNNTFLSSFHPCFLSFDSFFISIDFIFHRASSWGVVFFTKASRSQCRTENVHGRPGGLTAALVDIPRSQVECMSGWSTECPPHPPPWAGSSPVARRCSEALVPGRQTLWWLSSRWALTRRTALLAGALGRRSQCGHHVTI